MSEVGRTDPGEGPPSSWRTAAWVAAAVLWLLLSFGSLRREPGQSAAYTIGALFGRAVATLAIACLARGLYILARGRDRPFWSPWVLVIAGGVSLLLALARAGEELKTEAGPRTPGTPRRADDLLAELPPDLRYERVDPAEERRALGVYPPEVRDEISDIALRRVLRAGRPVAFVTILTTDTPLEEDDVLRGYTERTGAAPREIQLDGKRAHLGREPGGTRVVLDVSEDAFLQVAAADEAGARRVAEPLVRE